MSKISKIPHGVDPKTFYPIPNHNPVFTFLANKGLRDLEDRGGVQYLIKAYLEEFTKKDNVELILKINPAYGIPDMGKLFPELTNKNNPKITLLTDNYTYKQLNELYNHCDVFVSPTRAESFNLPCLEALACGKPVITTGYGGQTDFVNESNGWLIDYKLSEVEHDIQYEGICWSKPDIKHLRKLMRDAYNNQDSPVLESNCLDVAKKLTWDNTSKLIKDLL